MGFRQVELLLDAFTQPDPEPLAADERRFRLRQVIRGGCIPRVIRKKKREYPSQPDRILGHRQCEHAHADRSDDRQVAHPRPAREHDDHPHGPYQERRPEVRLQYEQQQDHPQPYAGKYGPVRQARSPGPHSHHPRRKCNDNSEFREFGWLEAERPHAQPAITSPDLRSYPGHKDQA